MGIVLVDIGLTGVGSCRSSTGYAALQFQSGVSKAHAEKEGQF